MSTTEAQLNRVMKKIERLAAYHARNYHFDADEARQEARIIAWKTIEKHPDISDERLISTVSFRIRDLIHGYGSGETYLTGEPRRESRNKPVEPLKARLHDAFDEQEADNPAYVVADSTEAHELVYHGAQITRALDALSDRQREVFMLGLDGYNDTEIGQELGISRQAVSIYRNRARASLQTRLSCLRPCA